MVSTAAGDNHVLALKSDGTVWAWGRNFSGQSGNNDEWKYDVYTPTQVPGLTGMVALAAGGESSVALKSDGTVWAWSKNASGQLGDGTTTNRLTPIQVPGLTGVVALASGPYYTLAVKLDGTVWTSSFYSFQGTVPGLAGVVALAAGASHSLALKSDGTVWAWGRNAYGQLGDGTTTNRYDSVVRVPGLSGVTSIAAGEFHSIAAGADGTVWAWGSNANGELGDGTTTAKLSPVRVVQGWTR
ncbi:MULTISPECIES: hypothetical protein [Corallococcus]|uniref:RCC1 domain-containing protein n=1 Tax=unclassified Corallococcus TaxID=2685029 RepID=UPI0013152729|nr:MULTISPECIES: hypothetical protein [Corallococcus]